MKLEQQVLITETGVDSCLASRSRTLWRYAGRHTRVTGLAVSRHSPGKAASGRAPEDIGDGIAAVAAEAGGDLDPAAWRRLYSARSSMRQTRLTVARSWPQATICSTGSSSSIRQFSMSSSAS